MREFRVGDPVEYISSEETVLGTGKVIEIEAEIWVIAQFERSENVRGERAFHLDGSVPERTTIYTAGGHTIANAQGGHLRHTAPSHEDNMTQEYPPEPKIGYGVFDRYGRLVYPGYSGQTQVGFGIFDLPAECSGTVAPSADNGLLAAYLETAVDQWKTNCLLVDFNSVENKLEFLIGCELGYTWLYTDQFGTEVRFSEDIDPMRNRHQLVFDYSTDNLVTGLMTMAEVQSHIQNSAFLVVANVEGDKITLSDGTVFHLASRYRENQQPRFSPASNTRALLMRNLVTQRERRDSTPNEPVTANDDAAEAVAA